MSNYVNDGQIPWWDIRNKVSIKRKTKVTESKSWSSYWMDDDSYDYFYDKDSETTKIKLDGVGGKKAATVDLAKAARLASVRRAVSNFVRILTNNDEIKVVFNSSKNSFTDGKVVVISAEEDPGKFDVLVGTALHESAHCVFSGGLFAMLKNNQFDYTVIDRFGADHIVNLHNIVNTIEDRRIDSEVYRRAPGYRPYYQAMYDQYWNAKDIAKVLIRDASMNVPTLESYMFRFINLTNPATKYTLNRLPGFDEINNLIDLKNILRFSDASGNVKAKMLVDTAMDIYQVMLDNLVENNSQETPQPQDGEDGLEAPVSSSGGNGVDDGDGQGSQSDMSNEDIEKAVANEISGGRSLGKSDPNVDKIRSKMDDLLSGNIKKKKITSKMENVVETMEESDIAISTIRIDGMDYPYVRVPRLTASSESILPRTILNSWRRGNESNINTGRRLGQIIVDRIKIRHDNNETKFSRRPVGKIDRRLIHSLGVNNENVFFTKITQDYKNSIIYLTIDCSSSMYGEKWNQSIVLTTGLAYAAKKINNFDIVVNLRYGLDSIWSINMFDSRRDPFSHFERWMAKFSPENTTPESVVYDIEKEFVESLKTTDNNVYFITMTDGGANYTPGGQGYRTYRDNFSNQAAETHCRKMMKRFKESGIEVLSYYIGNSYGSGVSPRPRHWSEWEVESFKKSYGKDGVFVPVQNFSMVSKSVNDLLMRSTVR